MTATAEQTQEPPADTLIQVFARSGIRAWTVVVFAVLFLIPAFANPVGIPLSMLHGTFREHTPNNLWVYFAIRTAMFVAIPALAVWCFRLVRRAKGGRALGLAVAFGLLCGGLRTCYVPEFDPVYALLSKNPPFVVTQHSPGFRFVRFLRIPVGATRDEVRARVGEGWSWFSVYAPHGVHAPADESNAWCFSDGVGTDDGWRYAVWFDENGRVKEKDAYYWYD